jgi:ParB family transcriptional regulator, chromosome partitioning protein
MCVNDALLFLRNKTQYKWVKFLHRKCVTDASLNPESIKTMTNPTEIVQIPLNRLTKADTNVRKTGENSITELAASIQSHGLLHNLIVIKTKSDKYQVIAGSRRLAALNKLAKDKAISKTFGVPCRVIDSEASTESSLAENIIRLNMHPADQFDAFRRLVEEGTGVEEVAARFGVTATFVRQRLKLANVAPRFIELYREEEITLDQLMALAITDDHSAQEKVWDSAQNWQKQPHALRSALTESKIDAAKDRRARFVGVKAYTEAGGQIDRDLFQPEHEGYLADAALLDRLTAEKLEALANEVRGEGWKWVEVLPTADFADLSKYGRIYPVAVPETPALQAEIEALQAEQNKIEEVHQDAEEYPEDVDARLSAIEERIDELNSQSRQYSDEQKTLAGAVVSIENIQRGLVRPEDKRKAQAAKAGSNGENTTGDDEGEESDEVQLSAALVEDLTAHRTAALRAVLATRTDVSLVAVTHALALQVCYEGPHYDSGSALSLRTDKGGCRLDSHAKGIETSPAQERLSMIHSQWEARIPASAKELWEWLIAQDQSVVLQLLAFCVGQMVHAVRVPHESPTQPRLVAADQLAKAVHLDMADWWTATSESYLGRVKKDLILQAITEGSGETNLEELGKLS